MNKDSQNLIIVADFTNSEPESDLDYQCIHILYQNGQFLCYIDIFVLQIPYGPSIDRKDNLFLA